MVEQRSESTATTNFCVGCSGCGRLVRDVVRRELHGSQPRGSTGSDLIDWIRRTARYR